MIVKQIIYLNKDKMVKELEKEIVKNKIEYKIGESKLEAFKYMYLKEVKGMEETEIEKYSYRMINNEYTICKKNDNTKIIRQFNINTIESLFKYIEEKKNKELELNKEKDGK